VKEVDVLRKYRDGLDRHRTELRTVPNEQRNSWQTGMLRSYDQRIPLLDRMIEQAREQAG
jgi:hypothetical protein